MKIALQIIIAMVTAFIAVNWVYFKILKIAKEKQIVDAPDARKLQKSPIPVLGGIAVFFGMVAGALAGLAVQPLLPVTSFDGSDFVVVLSGAILMLYVGAMDDTIGLTPTSRFVIEILTLLGVIYASGLCVDDLHGLWGVGHISWWIAVPLTIFGGVGIINAINMIDGVNGLSSGLCITCSVLFGWSFLKTGDIANSMLAFTVASALVPFFFHNVFGNKSRMFIGDAGTMTMGFLLTWFVIVLQNGRVDLWQKAFEHEVNLIALALAILSVPIFDTVRVMFMRIMKGESPFHPDKTHLHHGFVRMGISHSITGLIEILTGLMVAVAWSLFVRLGVSVNWQLYGVIIVSMILVWGAYFFFVWHEMHHTEFMHWIVRYGIKTQLGHTNWWMRLSNWLDGPEYRTEKTTDMTKKANLSEDVSTTETLEQDRQRLLDFLKGKAEVYVDDIKKRSGVNPKDVDFLVQEGITNGTIVQIKAGVWGVPLIVMLAEENKKNKPKGEAAPKE